MENLAMEAEEENHVIVLPPEIWEEIQERNRKSLVVKLLNPKVQKTREISLALPKAWRLTESVTSTTLEYNSKVMFHFESEADLLSVLNQQPWTFKDWMLVIDRFSEDNENPNYLRFIDFWVEISGIPSNYRFDEVIEDIGALLGEVLEVDNRGPVRARIRIDSSNELDFVREVIFGSDGEAVEIRFVYDNLKMFCQACGSLTHHKAQCPLPRAQ
ncbi:hypothetical protein AALP_AA8G395600 [Arabis alpina]|uniref:DUF4283 domain-containing protein n=1 Tax=Arabis alpina TaxID=50452 RepID=A0A087GCD0_ARAAL|nr:hypothetical protein AALP_AA8G395600 [Arabis alpina]